MRIFGPDLPKKGSYFQSKTDKIRHNHWILHIQISLVWNLSSNCQFLFFGPNLPKKVFLVKNWKSKHHLWIPHIQIRLTILLFFFYKKKGFSGLKQKKWTPHIFYIIVHIQISWNFFFFFLNCYLAAPRPTLGHYRGDSLTHPMLITAFFYIFDTKVTGSLVTRLGP